MAITTIPMSICMTMCNMKELQGRVQTIIAHLQQHQQMNGIIKDGECGVEWKVVFDNCSGQNRNNTVLRWCNILLR